MKRKALRFGSGFRVALGIVAVRRPRWSSSPAWLFVVGGTGVAKIKGQRYALKSGTLLLNEHGDQHEIRNTGRSLLKTLNLYSPPAYAKSGDELPRANPDSRT
jgi:mannose-6-phosphate isomerase-like protein (cupin superfamily)